MKLIETIGPSYDVGYNRNLQATGETRTDRAFIMIHNIISIKEWKGTGTYQGAEGSKIDMVDGSTLIDHRTPEEIAELIRSIRILA